MPILPNVTPCILSPVRIETNADLAKALMQTELDWADCAAKVDMMIKMREQYEKTATTP